MKKVDLLIANGTVLPMISPDGSFLTSGTVAVRDGFIVEIGPANGMRERYSADREIDATGCIVMPGFVDAHFHTAQQLLRGHINEIWKTEGKAFPVWRNYLIPFERALSKEDVYLSGLIAYENMLSVGTTSFAEAGGPHCESMIQAAIDTGIRGVFTTSTNLEILTETDEIPSDITECMRAILDKNEALFQQYNEAADGRIRMWIAMNQITVSSESLITAVADFAAKHQCGVHIHLCEGTYELKYALEKWGKRPTEVFHDFGILDNPVLAAHAVLLSDKELDILVENDVGIAHCAKGNFHLPGPPRLHTMLRRGMKVGVGSDGASGGAIGTLQRLAISKIAIDSHFASPYMDRGLLSDYDLVRMATFLGAKAIGLGDVVGSLEVGKEADIIVVNASTREAFPCNDPYFLLVNCLSCADVLYTIVGGRILMDNRCFKNESTKDITACCRSHMSRILAEFNAVRAKRVCRTGSKSAS